MNRWVGLGVIADNVVNIGRAMEKEPAFEVAPRATITFRTPTVIPAALALQQAIDHTAATVNFARESR
jgi:hypothetical protein